MEEEGIKQQVRLHGHPEDRDVLDCKSKRLDVTLTASVLIYWSWKRNTRDRSPQNLMIYKSETSNVLGWFLCQFYQELVSFSCVETNIKPPIDSLAYRPPVRSNVLLEKIPSD